MTGLQAHSAVPASAADSAAGGPGTAARPEPADSIPAPAADSTGTGSNKHSIQVNYNKCPCYCKHKNFIKFNIYFRFQKHNYHNNRWQEKKWMIHERIMNIKMQ